MQAETHSKTSCKIVHDGIVIRRNDSRLLLFTGTDKCGWNGLGQGWVAGRLGGVTGSNWEEILGLPLRPRILQWRARWSPAHVQHVRLNAANAVTTSIAFEAVSPGDTYGENQLDTSGKRWRFLRLLWDRSQSSQCRVPQKREVAWDWRKNLNPVPQNLE